jgi:hypothetical protein
MGRQSFSDESNRKHRVHSEHYVDDKFEKGTDTRNWKKNIERDEDLKPKSPDSKINKKKKDATTSYDEEV